MFASEPLNDVKVYESSRTPGAATVQNLRLTLSQQAPSSTNSHQNSKTREILSPRAYQPPRQQKQTGDRRSDGERERGRVTRTEKGGQGEWKKRADTTTTGVGNSSGLARAGKLSPYGWVSEARVIARLVWSAADGCFYSAEAELPRVCPLINYLFWRTWHDFFCRGSLRFPRLWCDKLRLWEM